MLNLNIHCINLFESQWKWFIVLGYFIILLNTSVQISSKKCDTKKERGGGANWSGGAKWKKYGKWMWEKNILEIVDNVIFTACLQHFTA